VNPELDSIFRFSVNHLGMPKGQGRLVWHSVAKMRWRRNASFVAIVPTPPRPLPYAENPHDCKDFFMSEK
jgi:hypothetical protein